MIETGFGPNYGVLKIVKIKGGLEEITKIQGGIAAITVRLSGLYRCKAESRNIVDG